MNRRAFLSTVAATAAAAPSPRPNIVFVLTDDQRWDEMSCAGHPFLKTPHIDRLAREGALFENAFVTTPLCSPSRASFLTGQYAHTHGIVDNSERGPLSHRLVTYPQHLQKAGYETAFIGKWHMCHDDDSARPGFDNWISFKGQGQYVNPPMNYNGERKVVPGYMTDILTRDAAEFIRRKRTKPFALCVWHKAVHDPTTPAERHAKMYADQPIVRRPNTEDSLEGKPGMRQDSAGRPVTRGAHGGPQDEKIRNQMRCLLSVDEGLGEVLSALEQTGQLDNTLVVFGGDNGYFWGEHKLGDKRRAYEEGIRIPLLMRYPRLIRPGTVVRQMVLNVDLAPTFLELGGVKPPAAIEGRSLTPLFAKRRPEWRKSFLTEYFIDPPYPQTPRWRSVRTERWKYIHHQDLKDAGELYDLRDDPLEMKNRIADPACRAILSELQAELARAGG